MKNLFFLLSLAFFFLFISNDNNDGGKSQMDFHCVIEKGEACGQADAGSICYLVNKDASKSYKVTVRKKWTQGNQSGSSDEIIDIPAGGRKSLGCNRSSSIPIATWKFTFVGEE